ncbi:MAG: arginine--tRNA ligase [Rickettsiaceae bacterium]|nr:arginine--tRNA ligase [Rickettsiaceae bacterium]
MNYKNIYESIKEIIADTARDIWGLDNTISQSFTIEIPKEKIHGHISTNAAMTIAGILKKSAPNAGASIAAKDIALIIRDQLSNNEHFESIEVAGPGFINFTLKNWTLHKMLNSILADGENFGKTNVGKGQKINIEFVSANPTGPMHIGHSRPAIYGDVLASVMKFLGFDVTKEYYINDAGGQIEKLTKSAYLRYKEALGEIIEIPSGYYPGEYLKDVASQIKKEYGEKYLNKLDNLPDQDSFDNEVTKAEFSSIVINKMLNLIKKDLADLNIFHDVFYSEQSLHLNGTIINAVEYLKKQNLIYEGQLEAPKGDIDLDWQNRDQLLFKSTLFGDDQDRSLTKLGGEWTYFAGDIGYAKSKIDRGFKENIIILGADHAGYVKRLKAVYSALSSNTASLEIILCQMVNFIENGQQVKMSKRAGSFTTVADAQREVGADVLRFMMLTRRNDVVLDFDLDLVKTISKENPVFYVQYARVRAISIINNAKENAPEIYKKFESKDYDLSHLALDQEIYLIRDLSLFPRMLSSAISKGELHKLAYYVQNIAAEFHSFWNLGKENEEYRFINDNVDLSSARLALVNAILCVLTTSLRLMGITPMDKM